ncbi:hypothetical protein, partial [Nocardia salmonicida]|uniref:hypothetical protein n=1 Tax=Nocardia salmonicida TaxID=53431 RepID=UPI0036504133
LSRTLARAARPGTAIYLDDNRVNSGIALRGFIPDEAELTFQHHEAITAVEEPRPRPVRDPSVPPGTAGRTLFGTTTIRTCRATNPSPRSRSDHELDRRHPVRP